MRHKGDNVTNENGYVIYPDSIGIMDLDAAKAKAAELSADSDEEYRIEDCGTEKVIARFSHGKEV